MATNLLDLIKERLTGDVVSKAAGFLGESPAKTTAAIGSAVPSILAGMLQKSSDTEGATALFDLLKQGNHDGSIMNNLAGTFGGGSATKNLASTGSTILNLLFGNKVGGITNLIASATGISSQSSSSLLGMLAPVVMGMLGKQVSAQGISGPAGLASMLGGQADFLKGVVPAGLTGLLGVTSLDSLASKATAMASGAAEAGAGGMKKLLPWVVLVLAAILIWWLLRGCNNGVAPPVGDMKQSAQEAIASAKAGVDSAAANAGGVWAALGKFFSRKLPNGVELSIPEKGIENKLIAFIEDRTRPVDKTTWFSFDRLTFETGKAALMPQSQEQLKNIAEILKAYPHVALKLGGYTDNTGTAEANLKLSQARAENVMKEIVKLGIADARLRAEGYGQEHPVADNATEEGRAQNRRIDVRVTKK